MISDDAIKLRREGIEKLLELISDRPDLEFIKAWLINGEPTESEFTDNGTCQEVLIARSK